MKTRIEPILQNDNTSVDVIYGKDEVSCNHRVKGNDIKRHPILQSDITSFDVICGKDKVSYNHTGNRRLRFAVALNLNRYRYAINRKIKRKVVESILQHIESAGGRFLEKVSTHEDSWIVVSAKVSRLKVSHALRDKSPINPIEKAKHRLNELFKHQEMNNEESDESFYNVINGLIFCTCINQYAHAFCNPVEKELSKVISKFLKKTIYGRQAKSGENQTAFNRIHDLVNSESRNLFSLVNRVIELASQACDINRKIPSDAEHQILYQCNTNKLFNDQVSVTELLFMDDLPLTFTADDCEQLIALLDSEFI